MNGLSRLIYNIFCFNVEKFKSLTANCVFKQYFIISLLDFLFLPYYYYPSSYEIIVISVKCHLIHEMHQNCMPTLSKHLIFPWHCQKPIAELYCLHILILFKVVLFYI